MQHIDEKDDDDGNTFWKCKWIPGHKSPLNKDHSSWKGDKHNAKVKWENEEVTYDPLHTIAADDSGTCAMYSSMPYYIPWNTMDCMLDTNGWKYFRSLAVKSAKKMLQMVNQSKLWSHKTCKKCMYSIEIPCSSDSGIRLDKLSSWQRQVEELYQAGKGSTPWVQYLPWQQGYQDSSCGGI